MKSPLKGLGTGTGLKSLGKQKEPLAFVPSSPNPLANMGKKPRNKEEEFKDTIDEIGKAFRAQAKGEKERYQDSGYAANYICVVFPDATQTNAFLEAVGYPDPTAMYVDGTMLADLLGWELPETEEVVKPLPKVHNPKLAALARPLKPPKGE